jgi:predicted nucleotidyltransferase component of viral defense system
MTPDSQEPRSSKTFGFRAESLEKATRLLSLLEAIRSHPFLRPRVALKGGTALNLFLFKLPRLSVDIDLNYVGASDLETMLTERPKLEEAIQAVCSRERLTVKRVPTEHAGGKWRLSYGGGAGGSGTLEFDINFILRVPLWPVDLVDSRPLGTITARQVPLLDRHEIAAGKLAALCARNASRDIFDARELLQRNPIVLDPAKLRLAFVVYGGINKKDWRDVRIEDIDVDVAEVERQLVPMLRADIAPTQKTLKDWSSKLVLDCRELMTMVLPLSKNELRFIEELNARGDLLPELLTSDRTLQGRIREHPGLAWKAQNVLKRARGGKAREL